MSSYTWSTECWPPAQSKLFYPDSGDTTSVFRLFRNAYCSVLRNLRIAHNVPYPESAISNGKAVDEVIFKLFPRNNMNYRAENYRASLELLCSRYAHFSKYGKLPPLSITVEDTYPSAHGIVETTLIW